MDVQLECRLDGEEKRRPTGVYPQVCLKEEPASGTRRAAICGQEKSLCLMVIARGGDAAPRN
nr:hypothetical protein [uncultured Pseudoxanthomonas sp.]